MGSFAPGGMRPSACISRSATARPSRSPRPRLPPTQLGRPEKCPRRRGTRRIGASGVKLRLKPTDKHWKIIAEGKDLQVHVYCLRRMDGIHLRTRAEIEQAEPE